MSKPIPSPGEYSLTELGQAFHVSRKTAERYVARYALEQLTLMRYNKECQGVRLTEEVIDKILSDNEVSIPGFAIGKDHVQSMTEEGEMGGKTGISLELSYVQRRLEEVETDLKAVEEENDQLKELLSEEKVRVARLQGQLENDEKLIEELRARLKDKDDHIEVLKRSLEGEKARADAFNNQIRAGNDLVLAQKTADAQFRELLTQIQALQQKAEQDEKPQNKSKGFRFMGFEISKPKG